MLTLLLASQLQKDHDSASSTPHASALYISTEAPLQTTRLAQILDQHPKLTSLPAGQRPSLSRIHSTHVHDVVAQDHILHFQVPVAIEKHNINLVVIDSIAANYRAEFDKGGAGGLGANRPPNGAEKVARRNQEIAQTVKILRDIAGKHNITVVIANQVADRFAPNETSASSQRISSQRSILRPPHGSLNPATALVGSPVVLSTDDPLSIDHQQRFFTGWGDDPSLTDLKTPSLGLALVSQLSTRITLVRTPVYMDRTYGPGEERELSGWDRSCRVVFSAWCAPAKVPFEIWEGGVRSLGEEVKKGT
jgi:DNA repair protein RAD57